jgi:hypothetical protein
MDQKSKVDFTFDEPTHIYRLNGEILPSITQILTAVGIINYGRGEVSNEAAMARGRAVHMACELYDRGTLDWATVTDEIYGHLTAWINFREKTGFEPKKIEEPAYHEAFRFAGRLDREGTFSTNSIIKTAKLQRVIVEIKSGEVEDWVALQTAAQDLLLPGVKKPRIRMGVQLTPTGEYKPRFFEDKQDHQVFLTQVTNYHWRKAHGYLNQGI